MKNSTTTVRIPVSIHDGKLTLADGTPFPALDDGTLGDLLLDPLKIKEVSVREKFLSEKRSELFSSKTSLWARVGIDYPVPQELLKYRVERRTSYGADCFVEIRLNNPLMLVFNYGTEGDLDRCMCSIPAFPEIEFNTLNSAFTAITKEFESTRKSTGGNVFNKVYFEKDLFNYPLSIRRNEVTAAASNQEQGETSQ